MRIIVFQYVKKMVLKSGIVFPYFGIIISNADTFCLRRAFVLSSFYLRS